MCKEFDFRDGKPTGRGAERTAFFSRILLAARPYRSPNCLLFSFYSRKHEEFLAFETVVMIEDG